MHRSLFTSITKKRAIAQNRVSILKFKATPLRKKMSWVWPILPTLTNVNTHQASRRFWAWCPNERQCSLARARRHLPVECKVHRCCCGGRRNKRCLVAKSRWRLSFAIERSTPFRICRKANPVTKAIYKLRDSQSKIALSYMRKASAPTNGNTVLTTKSKPTVSSFDLVTKQLA